VIFLYKLNMNKFVVFAALIAVALASSSSSVPAASSSVPAASSSVPVVSSSSVPVVSSSSSAAPVEPSSSSVPVEPSSSSVPVVSSSSAAPENKTFIPVVECATHFNLSAFNKEGEDPIVQEYWFYYNAQKPMESVMLTVAQKNYALYRCDLGNETGFCYAQGHAEEEESGSASASASASASSSSSTPVCEKIYVPLDMVLEGMEGILLSVEYSTAEYPKDFDCPDGSKDCKLYCNVEGTCAIADTKNRIVSYYLDNVKEYLFNLTYFAGDFDADIFAMEDCNGTKLSVPANPCGSAPSGSSAASTSNTTQSSSNGASFVQVAYAVLLAALLVALF